MSTIGINTLVYKEKLDAGESQAALLSDIQSHDVQVAEIRREYVNGDLSEISRRADELGLELYYSVPEPIACGFAVNPDLETYLTEASILGATHVKFNIGTLGAGASSESVQNAVSKFDGTVTIENDQTPENGTLASTVGAAAAGITGYTMDLGNWYWQNEDPEAALAVLDPSMSVLHLKNVTVDENGPATVLLDDGLINWKKFVRAAGSRPVILEYPMQSEEISSEVAKLKNIVNEKEQENV